MRKFILVFTTLLLVNLLVPIVYYKLSTTEKSTEDFVQFPSVENVQPVENSENVILYNLQTNATQEIELIDFLIGSSACEMPSSYETEAIKAQMIASYSYYLYCKDNPDYLPSTYVTFNETNMQGFASKEKLMEYWQMSFNENYPKFLRAANEVLGIVATYDEKPALTTYFAVSCGKTQNSEDEWGMPIEYLTSVDSENDAKSDDYLQMKNYTIQEMYDRLNSHFAGMDKLNTDKADEWFTDITYNNSGYVQTLKIDGLEVNGRDFREALELASKCFMVFYEDDNFSVATKGYGHGVGLSQFGANELSIQGMNYQEILEHYYKNIVIEKENKRG